MKPVNFKLNMYLSNYLFELKHPSNKTVLKKYEMEICLLKTSKTFAN